MELWAIGQHLGLKTPLIDWTRSFYVALYFAFYKQENSGDYRAVYKLIQQLAELQQNKENMIYVVEPKQDDYRRLTAQRGLFTYWGFDEYIYEALETFSSSLKGSGKHSDDEILRYKRNLFRKYEIANHLRDEILDYLNHIGINHTTIFPDMAGAIDKTNLELAELLDSYKNKTAK